MSSCEGDVWLRCGVASGERWSECEREGFERRREGFAWERIDARGQERESARGRHGKGERDGGRGRRAQRDAEGYFRKKLQRRWGSAGRVRMVWAAYTMFDEKGMSDAQRDTDQRPRQLLGGHGLPVERYSRWDVLFAGCVRVELCEHRGLLECVVGRARVPLVHRRGRAMPEDFVASRAKHRCMLRLSLAKSRVEGEPLTLFPPGLGRPTLAYIGVWTSRGTLLPYDGSETARPSSQTLHCSHIGALPAFPSIRPNRLSNPCLHLPFLAVTKTGSSTSHT